MTVAELKEFLVEEIKDGHGNHHVLLSSDVENTRLYKMSNYVSGGIINKLILETGLDLELEIMTLKNYNEKKKAMDLSDENYVKLLIFYPE